MSVDGFIAAVDAFVPVQKKLVGADSEPLWNPGRNPGERKLLLPIEVDGEQRGQQLMLLAYPNHPTLMFKIGIKFFDYIVCRLDFEPEAVHANNFRSWNDELPHMIHGPHWHQWELNRTLVRSTGLPFRLQNAVSYDNSQKFDATLRAYCAKWLIDLGHHAIELPPKDALL